LWITSHWHYPYPGPFAHPDDQRCLNEIGVGDPGHLGRDVMNTFQGRDCHPRHRPGWTPRTWVAMVTVPLSSANSRCREQGTPGRLRELARRIEANGR
jgi:hypothetical protein